MEDLRLLGSFVSNLPALIVWIVALFLSIVLLKKKGGKLARFLVAGSSLLLFSILLRIPEQYLQNVLVSGDLSNARIAGIISSINLFLGLISLAGIIFLFYAVWTKFNRE